MLDGNTVFIGDSITVGLPPFVFVHGDKSSIAKGGAATGQILGMVRASEVTRGLDFQRNCVVLGGTNDIGGVLSAETIFGNLTSIWNICKAHGMRVVALTIPPAKGYSGFASNFQTINAKRKLVNAMIMSSTLADTKVDLDSLLGSVDDRDRLAKANDSGDHLHPNKQRMGELLTQELNRVQISPNKASERLPGTTAALGIGVAVGAVWGLHKLGKSRGWF